MRGRCLYCNYVWLLQHSWYNTTQVQNIQTRQTSLILIQDKTDKKSR